MCYEVPACEPDRIRKLVGLTNSITCVFWLVDYVLSGPGHEVYRYVATHQQSACPSTLRCSVCAAPCHACRVSPISNSRPAFPSMITPPTACHHCRLSCLSFTVSMLHPHHEVPHGAHPSGVSSSGPKLALDRHDLSLCHTLVPHRIYTDIV